VTTFLIDQVVALIAVAVRAQLHTAPDPRLTREVCGSVLRLLGMTPSKAARAIEAASRQG
ncbi:MAG: hypothetical protein Q7U42_09635, partial [Parvibaculum sp.]|nr:hypothetical protein [Parvibaculum sp.]